MIIQTTVDEMTAAQMAQLFATLSDTSRVRIIGALSDRELSVSEIAGIVGISHSAVSHHLRHLRQMRLVQARKEGRYVYYSLDDEHVGDLFHCGLEHVLHG